MIDIVEAANLNKSYGDLKAVNDVSFRIRRGEIFGFLGPNGAGKTSTINMLIGLSRPSSGTITIGGIDAVRHIKKAQSIMGIVPDENNLYDDMDGFDNLCFCGSLYGMRKAEREQRAREFLEQFDLETAGKRLFKAYSKGMRRKLTIAAGLMHDPKILFIDELTTGIDVESARHIRELILELKQRGTTVFLTTHYIEDAQRICDRIAFIVGGRIVETGTVEELMENAGHEHIVRLALSADMAALASQLQQTFPEYRIDALQEYSCLIASQRPISLLPILQFLGTKGIDVYEAKEIHPSLEDVFVKVTGIEAGKLRKEKEAGKQ
jgi:ABC-2 type transport system ATP-binding protein